MAARLERFYEAELLFRGYAREDSGAFGDFGEFCIGGFCKLASRQGEKLSIGLAAPQSDLTGDGQGGDKVIASDHLHGDARALAFTHGGDGCGARRVSHSLQPEECEALNHVCVFKFGMMRFNVSAHQAQHAQTTCSHRFSGAMYCIPVQSDGCVGFAQRVGATFEQAFDRADFVDDAAFVRVM
jgi:hypothetical protein